MSLTYGYVHCTVAIYVRLSGFQHFFNTAPSILSKMFTVHNILFKLEKLNCCIVRVECASSLSRLHHYLSDVLHLI